MPFPQLIPQAESQRKAANRAFGFLCAAVFLVIAFFPVFSGNRMQIWALLMAGLFMAGALVRPAWLDPLNRMWTRLGAILNRVATPIVLGFVYYGVITPTGLVRRLAGKDNLHLSADSSVASYWIQRRPAGPGTTDFTKQY